MKIHVFYQIATGLWGSLAVALGIWGRSWEAMTGPLMAGVIGFIPVIALSGVKSERSGVRAASRILGWAFLVFMLFGLFNVVERIYLTNGASYPRWLATAELKVDRTAWKHLRIEECRNEAIEVLEKDNGSYVLRCGMFWYNSKTFITSLNPFTK
jgi:Na+/melibiose symporter-like transporter